MFRETKMPSAFALRFGFCIRKKSNLGYYRSQTFFFFLDFIFICLAWLSTFLIDTHPAVYLDFKNRVPFST